ncbi:activating signal cointegrator 1 complex subunit 1-like protein, partial [Euroglyphus maynei]
MLVKQALAKFKNRFTHLITIPFVHDDFIKAYIDFKEKLLHDNPDIDESLFQNPKKLHMTISCLSLEDEQRLAAAREMFTKQCTDYIGKCNAILERTIQIKGIDIMNDNPKRTTVLYAKIENENLQNLADNIAGVMALNGFLYTGDKHANHNEPEKQQ